MGLSGVGEANSRNPLEVVLEALDCLTERFMQFYTYEQPPAWHAHSVRSGAPISYRPTPQALTGSRANRQ